MAGKKIEIIDRDRGWAALLIRARQVKNSRVKVGVLAGTDKGDEREEGGDLTVAEIAAIMEFGTQDGRIPARSFVRSTFDEQREALIKLGVKLIGAVMDGKLPIDKALGMMGAQLVAEIRKKITTGEGVPPPNAPETIRRKANKGRTKKFFRRPAQTLGDALAQVGALSAVRPLVDTGRLLGAITWSVLVGGSEGE